VGKQLNCSAVAGHKSIMQVLRQIMTEHATGVYYHYNHGPHTSIL